MRGLLSAAAMAACLAWPAAALEVAGTVPERAKGAASADFNLSGVTVKGVAWENGAVVLPVTENKGRSYIDVKLLSRKLYSKLENCFKAGCPPPAKAPAPPAIKVEGFRPLKSKVRVANAEVSLDGELAVVLGVMVSSREPGTFWVAFPDSVVFSDGLKAAVEKKVRDAWDKRTR